jgi:S-DNA-T family DNA segregation ATPase FtsK/SpoIIIE
MNIARRSPADLFSILLLALAAISLLGLLGFTSGDLVDPWVRLIIRWFGWGAYAIPLSGIAAGYAILRRAPIRWSQVILVELLFFSVQGLMSGLGPDSLPEAELGLGGGIIGWAISTALGDVLGSVGRILGLLILAGASATGLVRTRVQGPEIPQPVAAPEVSKPAKRTAGVSQQFRKQFKLKEQGSLKTSAPQKRDARLPSLDLLETGRTRQVTAKDINRTAGVIEKTLTEFGLPAKVVDFRSGPSVTQFAVEPGYVEHIGQDGTLKQNKVRVSQISALANDLALALSAAAIRIEAPVPGKAYVGVEVPNAKPELVRLRPILDAEPLRSTMHIALGRDVAGSPVVADLSAMPHLLIAGTTGSGKSVCIAALATCLALNNSPDDLRFVLIDPKRVELLRFNGLPHLMGKVETDLTRIAGILRWCTVEMDRRFKLLEEASSRDIMAYNRKISRRKNRQALPRIVVMIDELSDLMMLAPDQTESALVRLAQMARATGIHLIVATQRPSTDVVTGLIKANFPARIAFAVASGVDSRVILDTAGAESLLGQGDMLYLAPEAAAPIRLQSVFVSDREVEALISDWKEQRRSEGAAPWEDFLVRQEALEEQDEVLEAAIELVRQTGQASASLLQRRLRIGFPRAARLMDELEAMGVIGRAQAGGRTREVLIEADDSSDG